MKVTAQDVAQLLVSPPPRNIPPHLAKAAQGGRGTGFGPLLGLAFFAFGLIFVVVFFPWRFIDDWKLSSDAARTVKGHIVSAREANMRINKVRVWDYEFSYEVGDGQQRKSHSYTTGKQWSSNVEVPVRYLPSQPELARLEGARLSETGGIGIIVLIFPLAGLGVAIVFARIQRNTHQLLLSGRVSEVDIISVDRTNVRVNNRHVYKIMIASSTLLDGRPFLVRRSDPAEIDLVQKRVVDKQPIYVLHDPENPRRLLFPEALIGR